MYLGRMEILRWLLKNGMNKADVDRVDKGLNAALLNTGWINGSHCCSPALKGPTPTVLHWKFKKLKAKTTIRNLTLKCLE